MVGKWRWFWKARFTHNLILQVYSIGPKLFMGGVRPRLYFSRLYYLLRLGSHTAAAMWSTCALAKFSD